MCSGRVDPTFVFKALALGADGVMIAGCHPGECHYIEQNYKAMRRFHMLKHTLQAMGVETDRVQLVWASAAEGQQLAEAIDKLVADVQQARPAELAGQLGRERRAAGGPGRDRQRTRRGDGGARHERANPKAKLAIYWAASCGGCEISILAIDEKILDVAAAFDIVMWPCAADGKVRDVEKMADGEHRRLPVQRRHPHQRAGIHGPTDAAEVEGPGGLRLLRQRRLHSRAWPT